MSPMITDATATPARQAVRDEIICEAPSRERPALQAGSPHLQDYQRVWRLFTVLTKLFHGAPPLQEPVPPPSKPSEKIVSFDEAGKMQTPVAGVT